MSACAWSGEPGKRPYVVQQWSEVCCYWENIFCTNNLLEAKEKYFHFKPITSVRLVERIYEGNKRIKFKYLLGEAGKL